MYSFARFTLSVAMRQLSQRASLIYKNFNNKPLTTGEVTAVRQAERGLKKSYFSSRQEHGVLPYGVRC